MENSLYSRIATRLQAMESCKKINNIEWFEKHESKILELVKDHMPSGSGFDNGTDFDFEKSTSGRLVFHTSFHHMNDNGSYDGWTEHTVTVRASLAFGITLNISGKNRNDLKDYMHDLFHGALRATRY
jgi:hypothetical protein